MKDVDMELLRTLADMEGYEIETDEDGNMVLTNDCPTFGGWHIGKSEQDVSDAINQLTYNQLHPLSD